MTTKLLQEAKESTPFRPFSLNLADGRRLRVSSPEMLAYVPDARTCAVWKASAQGWINVDLLLVTAIEPLSSKRRNGRRADS